MVVSLGKQINYIYIMTQVAQLIFKSIDDARTNVVESILLCQGDLSKNVFINQVSKRLFDQGGADYDMIKECLTECVDENIYGLFDYLTDIETIIYGDHDLCSIEEEQCEQYYKDQLKDLKELFTNSVSKIEQRGVSL
ncbi:hypothetical protein Phi19:2_gp004 [Cellulophaga phage phi19:2]|uniref:Uncharacterized protein n=2 Tax=Cellulophaga phage phiST TaxID=756282 RepID=M4SND6_9CAUD|nr:hypothetical protein CGPG_00102 [Cellulophaga phage phiST]AGH56800.1 hypothetical protein CGPG_00102 [Cellulophaga phage phiST]AGO47143.1 hypothetical protein PhiST_gp004 [Cellulophaga phage phiST]AGO48639.1 hypothetical protein Phi19:2_gp004 [Cellulophaga phage phi19:2]